MWMADVEAFLRPSCRYLPTDISLSNRQVTSPDTRTLDTPQRCESHAGFVALAVIVEVSCGQRTDYCLSFLQAWQQMIWSQCVQSPWTLRKRRKDWKLTNLEEITNQNEGAEPQHENTPGLSEVPSIDLILKLTRASLLKVGFWTQSMGYY